MRTYRNFIEATESDLKAMGANSKQIDLLKKRQEKRGHGFSKPAEQGSHFQQKPAPQSTGSATTPPKSDFQQKALPPSKGHNPPAKSPADVGADMMRQKNQNSGALAKTDNGGALAKTDKGGALARTDNGGALARTDNGGALAKIPPKPKKPKNVMQGEPAGRIRRNVDNGPEYSPPRTTKTKLNKVRRQQPRPVQRRKDEKKDWFKVDPIKAHGSKAEPGEGPRIQGQQT